MLARKGKRRTAKATASNAADTGRWQKDQEAPLGQDQGSAQCGFQDRPQDKGQDQGRWFVESYRFIRTPARLAAMAMKMSDMLLLRLYAPTRQKRMMQTARYS